MKILNLYAGIRGNRKLWGDEHEITAVEYKPEIAKIYQDFFPNDKMVIGDAHQYLLEHFEEFDFIWSSPPCPSHSRIRKMNLTQNKPVFPDMKLYEEILLLKGYYKGKYVIENVIAWYKPLIPPQQINKHYFWCNFMISPITKESREHNSGHKVLGELKGFDLSKYKGIDRIKALRNCVEPFTGKHILDCMLKPNTLL